MGAPKIKAKKPRFTFEDQMAFMTWAHFGLTEDVDSLYCLNCSDLEDGSCPGEGLSCLGVFSCMAEKVKRGERVYFQRRRL